MKTMFLILSFLGVQSLSAEMVHGYIKKDGTAVAPYFRSSPNQTRVDNRQSYNQPIQPPTYFQPTPSYPQPNYVPNAMDLWK